MLENMLKVKIEENEKIYADGKAALEEIINKADSEYSRLLSEYKTKIQNIKNDSMLTSDGKKVKATKVHEEYLKKAKDAAEKYVKQLQNENVNIIKAIEDEKVNNNEVLKGQKIPQIIYVSTMMNSINQLQDAPMLKEVFEYACLDDNFSTEIMNLIYMKANSLLNAANNNVGVKVIDETQSKIQERILNDSVNVNKIINDGKSKTMLTVIVTEINKYKHDYIKEFSDFKSTFTSWEKNNKYPQNLYIGTDPKRDFKLEGILNSKDPWNIPKKSTDPWAR